MNVNYLLDCLYDGSIKMFIVHASATKSHWIFQFRHTFLDTIEFCFSAKGLYVTSLKNHVNKSVSAHTTN